jgi:riboflavin kinase/FMN adenylyltransferase
MNTIHTLQELELAARGIGSAVTVGTFDGVHRGHTALVAALLREAAPRQLQTAVLTFADMPYFHFQPARCARLLTLPHEKEAAFAALNIDQLALLPFDAALSQRTADDFVREILVGSMAMKLLVIGPDFALGKDRAGDVATLRALGGRYGYETLVLGHKVTDGGPAISSTRIRECLEKGNLADATRMLGRRFSFEGSVVAGQQLGRKIGVPTINLALHPRKVLPAKGVYAVWVRAAALSPSAGSTATEFDVETWPAVLNIGMRPTVAGTALSIEFHVLQRDIPVTAPRYQVEMVQHLRAERKFDSLDELVAQIRLDIAGAIALLK